jgi:ribosomal protein S18 acetylase RimI-like enzyme
LLSTAKKKTFIIYNMEANVIFEKYKDNNSLSFLCCELTELYLAQVATLLNSEWPRSFAQRCTTLRSFCRDDSKLSVSKQRLKLPISLIILDKQANSKVIGHASLLPIITIDGALSTKSKSLVFLQSLIVDPQYRSRGLGKWLMFVSELYLRELTSLNDFNDKLELDYIYLNTKDKQSFYESIGYEKIEPITFYANKETDGGSKCNEIVKRLFANISASNSTANLTNSAIESDSNEKNLEKSENRSQLSLISNSPLTLPPPPPPPPPPLPVPPSFSTKSGSFANDHSSSYKNFELSWYRKKLTG